MCLGHHSTLTDKSIGKNSIQGFVSGWKAGNEALFSSADRAYRRATSLVRLRDRLVTSQVIGGGQADAPVEQPNSYFSTAFNFAGGE